MTNDKTSRNIANLNGCYLDDNFTSSVARNYILCSADAHCWKTDCSHKIERLSNEKFSKFCLTYLETFACGRGKSRQ